jgi:hypothetical protein
MNSKVILATLAATVAGFVAGFLIFGLALDPWYKHNTINYEGLFNEMPDMLTLFEAHIVWAFMLVYALLKMGVTTAKGGLFPGAIISGLAILSFDLFWYSMANLWTTPMVIVVDALANAVWGGIMGAVAAWVLGRGITATA